MHRGYKLWSCQNVCDALSCIFDNIYIIFGNKLYRQLLVFRWVQIVLLLLPICFVCFFRYERDFVTSLSRDNQADINEAFNSTSRF